MNAEQQRIAIAEWLGYVWYRAPQDKHFPDKTYRFLALPQIQEYEGQLDIWKQRADGTEKIIDSAPWKKAQGVDYVPDYPNDLNAMHEAERNLPQDDSSGMSYYSNLESIVQRWMVDSKINYGYLTWWVIHATSQQRSEALCRTLWPEKFVNFDNQTNL